MAPGATEATDAGRETDIGFDAFLPDQPSESDRTSFSPLFGPEKEPLSTALDPEKEPTTTAPEPNKAEVEKKPGSGEQDKEDRTDEGAATTEVSTVAATDDGFGDKGDKGAYWTVELDPPAGASEGLVSYIAMAEAAIQTAVDLLGRGMPEPPPKVDELLATAVHETLGKGTADEAYRETLIKVDSQQTSLLIMDNQVTDTSIVMAAEQDQTLRSIISVVEHLRDAMAALGGGDLTPEVEIKLMDLIANALELIYDKVTAVSDFSSRMAGDSENGGSEGSGAANPPAAGGGGAPAGGGGGLGSMMPMLAMLPMALMPLAGMIPDLLEKHEEERKKQEEEAEEAATAEPAPQPIDPTAPPGDATAPQDRPPAPEADSPDSQEATGVQV